MSTINVSNLVAELIKRIDSSLSEEDILYYTKAIQQLRTGNIFVVNYASNLPSASTVLGSLYYVNENETLYIATLYGWIEIYASSVNTIFSWGKNGSGVLGDGTGVNRCSPVREFCSATNWCQVSAGYCSVASVKTSGELWVWGSNFCGRLGDGTTTSRCSPVREFCNATDWCQVSAGTTHMVALKTTGEIWSWGGGYSGRLGDGTSTDRCSPVREICSATDWCQVSAGTFNTFAIKTSGELWAWGTGASGRLGDGTATNTCSPVREFCSATNWCQVSAGDHAIAIKTSGELWGWGLNTQGQVGDGTFQFGGRCSPVREICNATDWCQAGAGAQHSAAVKTSGQLWTWGYNVCGQLGHGTTTNSCSPVREYCSATNWCQASGTFRHTTAIKTSGELWAWGSGTYGELGNGITAHQCSPVREISSSTDWYQVGGGGRSFSIALKSKTL